MRSPTTFNLQFRYFVLFLAFIVSISSCSKLISDEYPEFDEIPTVNSLLVAGDTIKVHVSLSGKIDTTEIKLIDNAEVVITSSQGEVDTLGLLSRGLYISDLIVKEGVEYKIEVQIEGFDRIDGADIVPISVSAKIFDHTNQYRYDEEGRYMEGIGIEFQDNPNTVDYYEIAVIKREKSTMFFTSPFNENSELLLNEGFEPYSTATILLSDQLIRDTTVRLYLDYYSNGYGKRCNSNDSCEYHFDEHTMILEFRHVSESYYHYKKSFYLYEKNRYPNFIEGTASIYPIYTNIENGFGIFASYESTIDSIHIQEEFVPVK